MLSTVYVTQWQIKDYPTVLALLMLPHLLQQWQKLEVIAPRITLQLKEEVNSVDLQSLSANFCLSFPRWSKGGLKMVTNFLGNTTWRANTVLSPAYYRAERICVLPALSLSDPV